MGNDIKIINPNDLNNPVILKGHTSTITGLELINGTDLLISSSIDGTLKLWNIEENQLISTIIPVDKDKFILITPDNYYMAPKSSLDGIGFKLGDRFFPAQQFEVSAVRPTRADVVLAAPYPSPRHREDALARPHPSGRGYSESSRRCPE